MRTGPKEAIRVVKKGGYLNFTPAAPVLEKRDIGKEALKRWEFNGLNGRDAWDCIHRREFEELLLELADQVKIEIGEPRADLGHTSQVEYFTMTLQKLEKHNK